MRRLAGMVGTLRSLLVTIPLIYLATIAWSTASLIVSLFDDSGRAPHVCARWWGRTLLAISGVRVRVRGAEQLVRGQAYVFASNHQSYMDIPVVYGWLPADFRIFAKTSLFEIPFLGWHMRRAGNLPVGKDSPRRAARSLLAAARSVGEGRSVFLFPEGGRSADGRLEEFKEGTFLLAILAGVPVVPVTLNGTSAIMGRGSWHICSGTAELVIHSPIPTAGQPRSAARELAAQVKERIAGALEEAGTSATG